MNNAEVGDKVRTPDSAKDDFSNRKDGSRVNKYTGEIWSASHTQHSGGKEWKVGIGIDKMPTPNNKITVSADGKILKKGK